MTLTVIMILENSALISGINYILKYIEIESCYFKLQCHFTIIYIFSVFLIK